MVQSAHANPVPTQHVGVGVCFPELWGVFRVSKSYFWTVTILKVKKKYRFKGRIKIILKVFFIIFFST